MTLSVFHNMMMNIWIKWHKIHYYLNKKRFRIYSKVMNTNKLDFLDTYSLFNFLNFLIFFYNNLNNNKINEKSLFI